jgi:hypothetical protein
MAGMDSEQILGSCSAAGMHFLQDGAEYSGGDERKLVGDRYFDDIRGPRAWRGCTVNRKWARATRRGCTFFKFWPIIVAGMNGNLVDIDTSTKFESQRHGGDGQ